MARIYLASSWRNPNQPEYVEVLRRVGHSVYDFRNPPFCQSGFSWSELDPDWQNWTAKKYRETLLTHPRAAQGFLADLRAMKWADVGVLLLPCGRSAHLELGWMSGAGKSTIIVTQDGEEPELMALLADEIVTDRKELLYALVEAAS